MEGYYNNTTILISIRMVCSFTIYIKNVNKNENTHVGVKSPCLK